MIRFFGIIYFFASICVQLTYAQLTYAQSTYPQVTGSSGASIIGEVRANGDLSPGDYLVEVYDSRTNTVVEREPVNHGEFQLNRVPAGSYTVRLVTAQGGVPIVEENQRFDVGVNSLVFALPEQKGNQPISGVVSLHELQHPISKKAIREAEAAQRFAQENNAPKAIAKLENAIRIEPNYRDAHLNLGVEYAHTGRPAEAKAEFEKALQIGPPVAAIYSDLAWISVKLEQVGEAEAYARKALELEPANTSAQRVLQVISQR